MHVAVTLLANDCSFCSCDDKDLYTQKQTKITIYLYSYFHWRQLLMF